MLTLGKRYLLVVCSLASVWASLAQGVEQIEPNLASVSLSQTHQSEQASTPPHTSLLATDSLNTRQAPQRHPMVGSIVRALPMLAVGTAYNLYNEPMRSLRYAHTPSFRHRYDDYMQFVPLGLQIGMRLSGIEGSSHTMGQMLLADAVATGVMLGVVYTVKTTSRVLRPDGSTYNSFPSGHTAMAFTAATLLHEEYGATYPWLSVISYTAASAAGVGRVLNNRHWIGDVITGAALGYISGKLGYWLSDLMTHRRRAYTFLHRRLLPNANAWVYLPVAYTKASRVIDSEHTLRLQHFASGLGLHWVYDPRGYFALAEIGAEMSDFALDEDGQTHQWQSKSIALSLGWGYTWYLVKDRLALEAEGSVKLRIPKVIRSTAPYSLSTDAALSPAIRLSPLWHLNSRLSLRLDAQAEYMPNNWSLNRSGSTFRFALPNWSIGSTIAFRL